MTILIVWKNFYKKKLMDCIYEDFNVFKRQNYLGYSNLLVDFKGHSRP